MASNLKTNLTATPYPIESITKMGQYEDFPLQVSRNQIMGHQTVAIFGYTNSIGDTTTPQTIWEGANNATQNNYTYPPSASVMTLVSSNAGDTGAVFVSGLDANFNLLSESIVLTGTTPVTTVNSYFRINGLYYTTGANLGTIKIQIGSAGAVYGYINPGFGQSQMAVYTVPNGFTFYQTLLQANSTLANQAVLFQTQQIYNLPAVLNLNGYSIPHNANTQQAQISPFSTGFFDIPFTAPIPFPQGVDLQWQAKTNSGGINGGASVFIGGYLIANDGQAILNFI